MILVMQELPILSLEIERARKKYFLLFFKIVNSSLSFLI